jgi:hypothetical protein
MAKQPSTTVRLEPGTVLEPGDPLRRTPYIGPKTHAAARHGGAPWLPEHDNERKKEEEKLLKRTGAHRLPFADRSFFSTASIIPELLAMSARHVGIVGFGGTNAIVMFDAGFEVGYDRRSRAGTSLVTIVVRFTGEVETAFPGRFESDQIPLPLS